MYFLSALALSGNLISCAITEVVKSMNKKV
jgi:hypothetical protein